MGQSGNEMVPTYRSVGQSHLPTSFSSYPSSLGAAVVAAMLFGNPTDMLPDAIKTSGVIFSSNGLGVGASSYQDTTVTRTGSMERELAFALQDLFQDLAKSQSDLDPEVRNLLYSKLWDLYS